MKRGAVARSPQAQLDVLDAGLYIADGDPLAADRFVDSIHSTFCRLAQYPKLGRAGPELAPDLRSFPHGNYVVFYRPTSTGVLIVRVLHGSRDVPPLFEEE